MTQIEIFKQKFNKMVDSIPASVDSGAGYVIDEVYKILDSLEDEIPSELDEAAEKYLDGIFGEGKHQDFYVQLFIAGSEWQKAKMMENAVEGVAEELYNDGEPQCTVGVGTYFKPGEEVYVIKKED